MNVYSIHYGHQTPAFKAAVSHFAPLIGLFGGLGKSDLVSGSTGCSFVVGFAKEGLNVYRKDRKGEKWVGIAGKLKVGDVELRTPLSAIAHLSKHGCGNSGLQWWWSTRNGFPKPCNYRRKKYKWCDQDELVALNFASIKLGIFAVDHRRFSANLFSFGMIQSSFNTEAK